MGKQRARLIGFFNGKRRECELLDGHVHKDHGGSRWIRLSIVMPLSGQPAAGMPEAFTEQFLLMEKETSALNLAKNDLEIEGATVAIYLTDTMKSAIVQMGGSSLRDFKLVGEGVMDNRMVKLEFTAEMPYSEALRDWFCDHLHAAFWIEVESSQIELPVVAAAEKKKQKAKQGELVVQ